MSEIKKQFLEATHESGKALVMRNIKGCVVMMNLLKFRTVADYSAAPHLAPAAPISGAAAFKLYVEKTTPYLEKSGGKLLFFGIGGPFLIGPTDENWDAMMLVSQNSVTDFIAFASNQEYMQNAIGHRAAALEDSRLLPLAESDPLLLYW
ncbi:MAG: DUF1330 domain-containing protein [Oligoflexia bacterium]|nr:DUF1330 domain-containing protein [Oligoflexia bacterium]